MKSVTLKTARARKTMYVLGATLGVLLFSLSLFSQANFGRILGIVTDQSGGVISAATVTIIDTQRGVARTLTTDEAGEYNAPTLIPSTYTVRVEAKGFKKLERQNVVLEVGKEVRVDVTVQPGEQTQTVTVTESIPLVETTNATLGGTLNNADINDMPLNGRNFQNLMSLRPGVMLQPGGGPWTQSTNNIRPDESAWMIDGVLSASFYDATPIVGRSSFITEAATILPIDAIQEFNMEENPKAEYGWKPGAVVNVGVRSGTNTLHGAAYAFGRDTSFSARNVFNPGLDSTGTCVPNTGLPAVCDKTPVELKQFGGVVGGPIKKDKLFFFGGYEGLRSFIGNAIATHVPETGPGNATKSMPGAINALVAAGVPVSSVSRNIMGCTNPAAGPVTCTGGLITNAPATTTGYLSTFPNTNTSDNGVGKLDYRINSKNMINGMLWIGRYNGVGEDHAMVNQAFDTTSAIRNWNLVVNWIATPSSRVVNELRFGYTRTSQTLDPADQNVIADGKNYPINTGLGGFPNMYIKGFFDGGSLGSWRGRPQENGPNPFYDVQDSVSYLLGKHTFKFGGEFARIEADANIHDTRGRFDFRGGAAFAGSTPLEDFFAGALPGGSFAPNQLLGNAVRTLHWRSYAGFVQDDWRATPKLIINLGLRYSYVTPFRDANNLLGNFDPVFGMVQPGQQPFVGNTLFKADDKDFSPRVGFAWDVTGKGTTVVRGGAGIIYSTWVASNFLSQAGQTDFRGGSSGSVPTGACNVTVPAGSTCAAVGGTTLSPSGTITLGTVFFNPAGVNWNSPAGGAGVFPGGGLSCVGPPVNSLCNIQAVDPNLVTPYIENWNLSVTRAFTNNFSLEVGYVGNHGSRLTGFRDLNQIPPSSYTPANPSGVRPFAGRFPYLQFINQMSNYARSNYNSLQATLTKRVSHGLSFTSGYTYGHGLDNNSLNRFAQLPQDSTNTAAEYASSDFDIRHRFTLTGTYNLPGIKGFGQLLEGWKINSIVSIASPQPWNAFDASNNFTGSGDKNDRWNFTGNPADFKSGSSSLPYCTGPGFQGCSQTSGISTVQTFFSPGDSTTMWNQCRAKAADPSVGGTLTQGGCFISGNSVLTPPALHQFGTMGRNIFRDNGFKNWDFSIFKQFTFKERYGAQFRFEVFNVLNHPVIANPNGASNGGNSGDDISSGQGLGCGCSTPDVIAGNPIIGSGSARAMQLGLKLTF